MAAVKIDSRHAGQRTEGYEFGVERSDVTSPQAVFFFGQHNNRTAFGSFIGQRRQLRGVGQRGFVDAGRGNERGRLAIAEGNGAGLVEQQNVNITRGLYRAA